MLSWDVEIPNDERDRWIDKLATGVVARAMETPTILFLEMHKPLSFIASQGVVVMSPFLAPLVGFENVRLAVKLMERRENVELLIQRIEDLSQERKARKETPKPAPSEGGRRRNRPSLG